MSRQLVIAFNIVTLGFAFHAATGAQELANAVMHRDIDAINSLLATGVGVNEPQIDGSTALHWAVRNDDLNTARRLIDAGADIDAENRTGVRPLQLAAINGNPELIGALIAAGVDINEPLTASGDTALMLAARTGNANSVALLIDYDADIDARESWGGTSALMWAISEHHPEVVKLLLDNGANVEMTSKVVAPRPEDARGVEGRTPIEFDPALFPAGYANGGFTALLFAAREGELEAARLLLEAGANIDAVAADGKNTLGLAIYNGHYELASFLIERGADVNQADAENFPPLFWAVDRRNMEWNPGFPWTIEMDPLPLIAELLEAGADPNTYIDNRPESRRNFGGSPRVTFATSLMRAAYSGDVELVRLLIEYGADPLVRNSDNENALLAASGYGWIDGYSQGRSTEERLETIKLLVDLGADVNWACNDGITSLMVAANFGEVEIIQYLIDAGADVGAHDLGKKNDGIFGGSIEPLMAIDYAIGVGSFRPNNAIIHMEEATALLMGVMAERGITHTTSECTLRAFSCGDVDPQGSLPFEIAITRNIQVGNQVEAITGGLAVDTAVDGADQ